MADNKLSKKEVKNIQKGRQQAQKARSKAEKKPAKVARQQTKKEGSRTKAVGQVRKVQDQFLGLPTVLWPFVAIVAYIWARNTWEKESHDRDIREAKRFLHESRGFRI